MKNKFYITTTLPYINADPHIGFAREVLQADVWARWHREKGDEVFFNTGTDEHGLKVFRKAQEEGLSVQDYCDREVKKWQELKGLLNLSNDNFIRTTDAHHIKAAQEFWRICKEKGFIEKKQYKIKYCVGCELEKTESELENNCCSLHPDQELEIIDEENYFFAFSQFKEKLLNLYSKNPQFVVPEKRFNEIKKFIEAGPQDFSISRLKTKMPWGVLVPGDGEHVMYVWFDALISYISAIGWPDDMEKFNKWWPAVQIAGKDNLRQQSAMWQAMLMAADLPHSRQIFIGGFITSGGQKMSKSLGNVISPQEMVEKFDIDGTHYLLLTLGDFGEDADATMERLTEKYNADLANGLGNLVSRVAKMNEKIKAKPAKKKKIIGVDKLIKELKFKEALDKIWQEIAWANKYIEEKKLWELIKSNSQEAKKVLTELLSLILEVAENIAPFMPETSEKIKEIIKKRESKSLFPRV